MSFTKRRKVDAEQASSMLPRESEGREAEPPGQDAAMKTFKDLVPSIYFNQMRLI